MKKWMMILLLTVVVASISACSIPGTQEKDAGEGGGITTSVQYEEQEVFSGLKPLKTEKVQSNKKNEHAAQGMTKVFSNLMSLKLPQGLEVQSKKTSKSKLVYADRKKIVKLEMWLDPEQTVTDAGIDGLRLKMKSIMEQDGEGEKLEWLKDETMLVHGKHIAVNEVIIPSQKGDTYRLVGWAELDGAFLEIKFSAPADEKDAWQKAVVEMIESIQM